MAPSSSPVEPLPLIVDNVHVRYGDRDILNGVSMRLHRGEVYGLLGPNGAGKSTLMRVVAGRAPVHRGRVFIQGARIEAMTGPAPALGRVSQRTAVYDHLTTRENLWTFGRVFGLRGGRLRARVRDVIDRLDLGPFADTRTDRLSGGMRQRLHIAVALLTEPRVLLLDEPTVGVDLAARRCLYDVLANLRAEGLAVLMTTHDLPEARLMADRIGILVDGRLVAEGRPDCLIDDRFGGARQALVRARGDAGEDEVAFLDTLGLSRLADSREWTGLVDEGTALERLFQGMREHPDVVTELSLTRPDLDALLSFWNVASVSPAPPGWDEGERATP